MADCMDRCDEDLVLPNGLYIHSEEVRPQIQMKYWFHTAFRATEREGEFHALFEF